MRALITALLVSLPAAAQAQNIQGFGRGDCGCCGSYGGLIIGAAYALMAALGYWVLTHSAKETASLCVKRIGDVVGSVLVIVGLLGLLCAVIGHTRDSIRRSCAGPGPGMMSPGQPQGLGMGMGMMPPGQPGAGEEQAPPPAPKKEKPPKPR
jgi:hypothetical protein